MSECGGDGTVGVGEEDVHISNDPDGGTIRGGSSISGLEHARVGGKVGLGEEDVGGNISVGGFGDAVQRHAHSPVHGAGLADVLHGVVVGGLERGAGLEPRVHHGPDSVRSAHVAGRVDYTEHALLAMLSDRAVKELRVCSLDGHIEDLHTLGGVLDTGDEVALFSDTALVADSQSRRESSSVVVGTSPDIADSVTDGGVDGEWHITEACARRSDENGVDGAGSSGRWETVLAFHSHGAWR